MEKLKVLHIVEALGGGVYSYFIDLSNSLGKSKNIETTIIYSDKRPEIIPEKIKSDLHPNTKLILVKMEKEISLSDLFTIAKLTLIIKKVNPDIVHLHSSKMTVIGRLSHLFSFSKSNLFYSPHGYAFLRKDIPKNKRKFYYLIEKFFAKLRGVTIACGDTEYEYAKKFGKAILIRNGIKVEDITNYYRKKTNPKLTIGILGRITFARNPNLFNKIALKNPDIQFLWIGDGQLRKEITAPNILVTGWFMSREEGLKQLNNIDVYLQTSLWEGLPIAVLEAMAMKKPVLATNIIGNKDVVKHGNTGYLFNNIGELNNFIKLLKNEFHRHELGENGLNRVDDIFNCDKNFKSLQKVYDDFYNSKHSRKY